MRHIDFDTIVAAKKILDRATSEGDCLITHLKPKATGYADIHVGNLADGWNKRLVHRVVYEFHHGRIPEGLTVDHLCRNRKCVQVRHLELVTGRENTLRGEAIGAINLRKTHCKRGHPFDEDNTYRRKDRPEWRACKECRNMHAKNWVQRQ